MDCDNLQDYQPKCLSLYNVNAISQHFCIQCTKGNVKVYFSREEEGRWHSSIYQRDQRWLKRTRSELLVGNQLGHHHHQTHHHQLHNHDMHIITIIIDTTLNQNFWKFSYHTITQHQIFMPSLPKENNTQTVMAKHKTTHLS